MTLSKLLSGDFLTYAIGYILALSLTVAAFCIVHYHLAPAVTAFALVLALGFVQIVVHMRCFLHISLERSARSDLMLILFSTLIIALMVGGTLVVLFNLQMRMM